MMMQASAAVLDVVTDGGRSRAPARVRPSANQDADGALVDAWVNEDDDRAFATLVRRYQGYVFSLALSVLGPGGEGDAQDVAQEVFMRVAQHLRSFRGESSFRTWLHRLALNLALDRRRRTPRAKCRVDPAVLEHRPSTCGADDPFSTVEAVERRRSIGDCVEALPDATRSVIHLHYWLELSVDEIATMLHVAPGTVKSQLHRGRKLLYRAMCQRGVRR
jgi:RNA polymerase sigma-70 factor (ECF subfamily)